jgi:hypothetical protein
MAHMVQRVSLGVPVFGGPIDSVIGIVTGTAFGITGAVLAVVRSITG